jgi:hypothetical protein
MHQGFALASALRGIEILDAGMVEQYERQVIHSAEFA